MTKSERPAVIVFAREPISGQTKTRLIGKIGARGAARLAHAFTIDALRKASSLRPSRLVIAGTGPGLATQSRYFTRLGREFRAEVVDQGRGTLGQRMAAALGPHSEQGAVLIGTDTPSLPSEALTKCAEGLRTDRIVLGPSLDRGYYLIGVRGALPDVFRGIRWGGGRVLAATVERLRKQGIDYALGPAWYDVDRWSDLVLLVEHLRRELGRVKSGRTDWSRKAGFPCPATVEALRKLGLLERWGGSTRSSD